MPVSKIMVAVVALFLSCCASPYQEPFLDQLGSSGPLAFDGVADYLKQGDVRIIWIHGMCDHDYTWATKRRDALYKAVGASRSRPVGIDDAYEAGRPYSVRQTAYVGSSRLDTDYLVWSPLSKAFKDRLRYDDVKPEKGDTRKSAKGQFPYRRASLNKALKQTLINRCLIDAVVYAGPNGEPIRHWVKAQICGGFDGTVREGKCHIPASGIPPRTILVAESLGSKILFDALRAIWNENRRSLQAAQQLASVQSVFLLANQIPLLDAADRPADGLKATEFRKAGADWPDFRSVLLDARAKAFRTPFRKLPQPALPDLQLVAFTDPNDLLSYRLSGEDPNFTGARVINVIVSNAPTYFGLFEMPNDAHCGYKWNRYVLGAVAFGYHDGLRPLSYELPKQCGLVSED